jgi:hypothetical protein
MHTPRLLAIGLAAVGIGALAPAALASPNQSVSPAKLKSDWTSPTATGLNTSFFLDGTAPGQKGTCGAMDNPQTACDKTLVHLTGVVGEGSSLKFRIDGFLPVSDFDIRVYTADEKGAEETYLGSPTDTDICSSSQLGCDDPRYTGPGDYENKVVDAFQYADPETGVVDQWFAVEVPYFIVSSDAYQGHVALTATEFVPPAPEEE